jgi:hypothetical protein
MCDEYMIYREAIIKTKPRGANPPFRHADIDPAPLPAVHGPGRRMQTGRPSSPEGGR